MWKQLVSSALELVGTWEDFVFANIFTRNIYKYCKEVMMMNPQHNCLKIFNHRKVNEKGKFSIRICQKSYIKFLPYKSSEKRYINHHFQSTLIKYFHLSTWLWWWEDVEGSEAIFAFQQVLFLEM